MFDNDDGINPYLQQEVYSASPARLRWMLIRKASELCTVVSQMWESDSPEQADQWLLRIRDILGELLSGVTVADDELGSKVTDFYIFLIQLVTELESQRSTDRLATLQELLEIEQETWRQFIEAEASSGGVPTTENSALSQGPNVLPFDRSGAFGDAAGGSFNLEV